MIFLFFHHALSASSPEGGTKPGVVEIKYTENYIKLYYPKDDDFRKIVKDHRYSWDGVWKRKINELTGDFPDRAGEIGKALLTGGFTVRFPDMAAKEKALTTYIPECDRWIKRFEDQLAIWWTPYNEKIYKAARSLPGAGHNCYHMFPFRLTPSVRHPCPGHF